MRESNVAQCNMWVEVVVSSRLASRVFYITARGFNKHRRPTKSVGFFDQRRRLLSA